MNVDHSDQGVKGLDRYFPDTLSRALLVALLTAPPTLFAGILQFHELLLPQTQASELTINSLCFSLALALLILLSLAINLSVIIYQTKHSRIKHRSNQHPNMSFKWLAQNAESKHYILLVVIFVLGVSLGIYVQNL